MSTIDLNADVGELDPDIDARILQVVSSVNIACGGHAGDEQSMGRVARIAAAAGVRIGAHPSYVDRENFGRTRIDTSPTALIGQLRDQIAALRSASPAPVAYVKPHGALYHVAASDPDTARAVVAASDGLALMGQAGAEYLRIAEAAGLETITEGFADRAYTDDGSLVPRTRPGAVLHEEHAVLNQVSRLARGQVLTITGEVIEVRAQSLCLHSDTVGAARLAVRIAAHLRDSGFEIRA